MRLNILTFITLSSIFILPACGGGGGGGNNKPVVSVEQFEDVTDHQACVGAPHRGATLQGKWYTAAKSQQHLNITSYDIDPKGTTLINECHYTGNDQVLKAELSVTSNYDANSYSTSEGRNSVTIGNLTCTIFASTSPIQYEIVGPCISYKVNGETHFLVPTYPQPNNTDSKNITVPPASTLQTPNDLLKTEPGSTDYNFSNSVKGKSPQSSFRNQGVPPHN